ncbi:hypothetical protein BD779DRAFT_1563795, partial [Infundibulicybe gibba]
TLVVLIPLFSCLNLILSSMTMKPEADLASRASSDLNRRGRGVLIFEAGAPQLPLTSALGVWVFLISALSLWLMPAAPMPQLPEPSWPRLPGASARLEEVEDRSPVVGLLCRTPTEWISSLTET